MSKFIIIIIIQIILIFNHIIFYTNNNNNNSYFKLLLNKPWKNVAQHTDPTKTLWLIDNDKGTILLNTDMTLGFDISTVNDIGVRGQVCGPINK